MGGVKPSLVGCDRCTVVVLIIYQTEPHCEKGDQKSTSQALGFSQDVSQAFGFSQDASQALGLSHSTIWGP